MNALTPRAPFQVLTLDSATDKVMLSLRELLVTRVVYTPRRARACEFVAECSDGRVLRGVLGTQGLVTPAGFEPAISTLKGSRPWPG